MFRKISKGYFSYIYFDGAEQFVAELTERIAKDSRHKVHIFDNF